jgi:hypothetical protein
MPDKPWLVMGIGCLECSVKSEVLGLFATVEEAEKFADGFDYKSQFVARVFDLSEHLARRDVVNA